VKPEDIERKVEEILAASSSSGAALTMISSETSLDVIGMCQWRERLRDLYLKVA
jgi:hypothetical protein